MTLLPMLLTFLVESDPVDNPAELITPYLPLVGVIAGALVVGGFGVYNRKKGNVETRAPDVNEIWQQQAKQGAQLDQESTLRRMLQSWGYEALAVFRGYVARVQAGGSTQLTNHERKIHDGKVPDSDRRATQE